MLDVDRGRDSTFNRPLPPFPTRREGGKVGVGAARRGLTPARTP